MATTEGSVSVRVVALALLLLAAGGAGAWWLYGRAERPGGPAFNTVTVDRGAIQQGVRATGTVSPVREIQVGSQISGMIEELLVDFNSEVRKGQLIARLDTSTHEAEVALARAELRSAEAVLELALLQEERQHILRGQNMAAQETLDRAVAERRQAEAQVEIRRSRLDKAQLELARCSIVSPTDGIVISRNVDVGQTVAASLSAPVLFEIADDLTRMQIIANVPEADIGRLALDQRVEFRVDAFRDETFNGSIVQIRNAPRLLQNVVTYDTVVAVDNSQLKLKPGMTAEVFIITEENPDTVRVRNAALRARLPDGMRPEVVRPPGVAGSARMVYSLQPDGSLTPRWIETGISDGLHTEVVAGLQPGDILVTGLQVRGGTTAGSSGSLLGGRQARF